MAGGRDSGGSWNAGALTGALPSANAASILPENEELAAVGPYRVIRKLGSGGMGTVYLCQDVAPIDRRVAVKVIHRAIGATADGVRQFVEEIRALSTFKHPSIVEVLTAGTCRIGGEDRAFFVMPYHEDHERLGGPRSAVWPLSQKLEFFLGVCDAVANAHRRGWTHADLKPSNIMVVWDERGMARPMVIDFGLARVVRKLGGDPGQVPRGTPRYMDPAIFDAGADGPDQKSDQFALGVTLAEFLTGEAPSGLSSDPSRAFPSRYVAPSIFNPEIDPALDRVILAAANPNPGRRFDDVLAFASALSRSAGRWARANRFVYKVARRHPPSASLLLALVCVLPATALAHVLYRITPLGRWAQGASLAYVPQAENLDNIRIVEVRDADAFAAAVQGAGVEIFPDQPGGMRPAWAHLARKLAEPGTLPVVGFDLSFPATTSFDADLAKAMQELAARTRAQRIVVGLTNWSEVLPPELAAANGIIAGALSANPAEENRPVPCVHLALRRKGDTTARPTFALLVAALKEMPGWEPRVTLDQLMDRVTITPVRRDATGHWEERHIEMILAEQPIQAADPFWDGSLTADDRMALHLVSPPSDEAMEEAGKDIVEVLQMTPHQLATWVGDRALIVAHLPLDTAFACGDREIKGAYLQGSVINSLNARNMMRVAGLFGSVSMAVIGAIAGALMGLIAARWFREPPSASAAWGVVALGIAASLAAAVAISVLLVWRQKWLLSPLATFFPCVLAFAVCFFTLIASRVFFSREAIDGRLAVFDGKETT